MRPRDVVKSMHERSVVERFVAWLNERAGKKYAIVGKPEPPDAVLACNGEYKWVEHADVYRSWEEAKEEYSTVTPGEVACLHREHPIFGPDARFAFRVYAGLRAKLSKSSYAEAHRKYGLGLLVLTERDALCDESTLHGIRQRLTGAVYDGDKGYFEAAFLGVRCLAGLTFFRLYPSVEADA